MPPAVFSSSTSATNRTRLPSGAHLSSERSSAGWASAGAAPQRQRGAASAPVLAVAARMGASRGDADRRGTRDAARGTQRSCRAVLQACIDEH